MNECKFCKEKSIVINQCNSIIKNMKELPIVEDNIKLEKKLTQQEAIIAKLTEALEDISSKKWFGEVYIYARKTLQEIKEMK